MGIKRLNIMVKKGHELDVEYSRKVIIDRINTFFGYEFVNNIRIIPFEDKNEKFKKNKSKEMIKSKFIQKISKYSFRFIELEKFSKLQKFRKKVGEYHFWTQRSRKNHQNQDSDSLDYPYGPKPKFSIGGTKNYHFKSQNLDRKG